MVATTDRTAHDCTAAVTVGVGRAARRVTGDADLVRIAVPCVRTLVLGDVAGQHAITPYTRRQAARAAEGLAAGEFAARGFTVAAA